MSGALGSGDSSTKELSWDWVGCEEMELWENGMDAKLDVKLEEQVAMEN